ncbi:MAG: hypothetical protein V3U67_03880 [Gemmatimonadota bacterium]
MCPFNAYDDEEEFGDGELEEDSLEPDDSEDDSDFDSDKDNDDLVAAINLDDEEDDWGFDDPEEIEDDDGDDGEF